MSVAASPNNKIEHDKFTVHKVEVFPTDFVKGQNKIDAAKNLSKPCVKESRFQDWPCINFTITFTVRIQEGG